MKLFDSTVVHADLTIIHGNNLTPEKKGDRWGYMPWRQTQMFPFRWYTPIGDESDPAYFRAILEHIRKKVFR